MLLCNVVVLQNSLHCHKIQAIKIHTDCYLIDCQNEMKYVQQSAQFYDLQFYGPGNKDSTAIKSRPQKYVPIAMYTLV